MYASTNPRMKTAAALLRGGGQLHIVGRDEVHTLADPDGALRRLVELADGSRSTDKLFGALAADYPSLGEQDVVDVVRRAADGRPLRGAVAVVRGELPLSFGEGRAAGRPRPFGVPTRRPARAARPGRAVESRRSW